MHEFEQVNLNIILCKFCGKLVFSAEENPANISLFSCVIKGEITLKLSHYITPVYFFVVISI